MQVGKRADNASLKVPDKLVESLLRIAIFGRSSKTTQGVPDGVARNSGLDVISRQRPGGR